MNPPKHIVQQMQFRSRRKHRVSATKVSRLMVFAHKNMYIYSEQLSELISTLCG
jgi:hypothetical protein